MKQMNQLQTRTKIIAFWESKFCLVMDLWEVVALTFVGSKEVNKEVNFFGGKC